MSRAFAERRDELGGAGIAIGIVPGSLDAEGRYTVRRGYPNPWVELAVYTHLPRSGAKGMDMLSRNHINVLSADAVVALAGGPGTQSEIALALRYRIPLIAFAHPAYGDVDRAAHIGGVREFLITQLSEP
jgi:predicted Rossmann-fold nucleotide-binding protein